MIYGADRLESREWLWKVGSLHLCVMGRKLWWSSRSIDCMGSDDACRFVSTTSDLMQNFKTGYPTVLSLPGYLTFSSPKSMFISQLLGTVIGCNIAPLTFWIFWTTFDLGPQIVDHKVPSDHFFGNGYIWGCEEFLPFLGTAWNSVLWSSSLQLC